MDELLVNSLYYFGKAFHVLLYIIYTETEVTNSDSAIWACCGHKLKGSDSILKVTQIIYLQEARESPAFPHTIDEIENV